MELNVNDLDNYYSELGKRFREVVKGTNWITPTFISYREIKDGVVEISIGPKIFDLPMFGITVVKNNIMNRELSKCLHSMEEVEEYIKELNK